MWCSLASKVLLLNVSTQKKYDGNMKVPDNETPTFGYSKQVDFLKISVSGLCSTDYHVPHSGAICAVQLAPSCRVWAKNGKPCIGSSWASWLLPSNKGGTGRTGRIKRRKVSTRYVGIESIRLFSIYPIYPIYLMLLSQYMVKFGIDGE